MVDQHPLLYLDMICRWLTSILYYTWTWSVDGWPASFTIPGHDLWMVDQHSLLYLDMIWRWLTSILYYTWTWSADGWPASSACSLPPPPSPAATCSAAADPAQPAEHSTKTWFFINFNFNSNWSFIFLHFNLPAKHLNHLYNVPCIMYVFVRKT